jgi:hypothetical protein
MLFVTVKSFWPILMFEAKARSLPFKVFHLGRLLPYPPALDNAKRLDRDSLIRNIGKL